jgi:leucyl-tRNA synthetase
LPQVDHYEPSGTGESPLVNIKDWLTIACPICGQPAQREANTMPQWAGSSWYYLRYIDSTNQQALVDKDLEKYWSPVDLYVGGAEHATRHLIYARFWHKFLYDLGIVNHPEPFIKLRHVGLIMGEDSRKMSKRWNMWLTPMIWLRNLGPMLCFNEMFMGPLINLAPGILMVYRHA